MTSRRRIPVAAALVALCATVLGAAGCSAHSTVDHHSSPTTGPAASTSASGTSSPGQAAVDGGPPVAAGPSQPSPGRAPLATARELLSRQLRTGEDENVVAVPSGYDGVLFDNVGHLRFFHSADGQNWQPDTTIGYRYDARDASGQHLSVTGALLTGMKHATFVLHGTFSGDGSGLAMAYTRVTSGWGPVFRRPDDGTRLLVGSALPGIESGYQVSYRDLSFFQGYLIEKDCGADVVTADCGGPGTVYTAYWLWDGGGQDFRSAQ